MKVLCAVLVGLVLVSVVALADGPRADVSVTPAGNSVDVTIAVDILQAFRAPAVRAAPLLGKPFVATWETAKGTARYVNAHKLPALGWSLGGYALKRAIDGKLDHDLKDMWVKLGLRDDPKDDAAEKTEWHARYDVQQVGTNNAVEIEYQAGDADDTTAVIRQDGTGNSVVIKPQGEEEPEESKLAAYSKEVFGL